MIFAPAYSFNEVCAFSLIENVKHFYEIKDSDKNVTMCIRSLPIEGIEIINHRIKNNLPVKYILDFSLETFSLEVFNLIYSELPIIGNENILLVHNICDLEAMTVFPPNIKTVALNIFPIEAYVDYVEGKHDYNKSLVVDRQGGMNLLIGKLKKRTARFLTTYYFYKYNLLDDAVLGINAYEKDIINMMENNPKYDYTGYFEKIKNYLGPADREYVQNYLYESNEGLTVDRAPFDPNIFKISQLSYVCETYDERPYPFFLTEKFYRPIVNRHPFVLQACSGQLQFVKSLGYQTFNNIIDESYNDYNFDHSYGHVEKTVLAGKDLLSKLPNHLDEIQEIVNFNFNLLCETAKKELSRYRQAIMEFDQTI